MKKLHFLLLLSILLTYSCSKDDTPEQLPRYDFRIELKPSGNYQEYDLSRIFTSTLTGAEEDYINLVKFRNTKTKEEKSILIADLDDNEDSYEFESVGKISTFVLGVFYNSSLTDEVYVDVKIYRDDKLFYEDKMTFTSDVHQVILKHSKGKIIRSSKV